MEVRSLCCTYHQPPRVVRCVLDVRHTCRFCACVDQNRWNIPNQRLRPLFRLGLVGMILANLFVTAISTFLSMHNYPGGEVWRVLEDLQRGSNETGRSIQWVERWNGY